MLSEEELLVMVRGLDRDQLRRWVESGWVRPSRRERVCVYSEVDVARIRLIRELLDDLRLDEEGIPVVLSLLDQVYGLRRALRQLAAAVDAQPELVRREIVALCRWTVNDEA